jgi:hypothetical protein
MKLSLALSPVTVELKTDVSEMSWVSISSVDVNDHIVGVYIRL